MKLAIALTVLLLVATFAGACSGGGGDAPPSDTASGPGDGMWARVTHVVDGDTVCVDLEAGAAAPAGAIVAREGCDSEDNWPVRLAGIDTTETSQCWAGEATQALQGLMEEVRARRVWLEIDPAEKVEGHGRILGYLWTDLDGNPETLELVNEALVREGFAAEAHWYPNTGYVGATRYKARLQEAEAHAREVPLGLWSECIDVALSAEPSSGEVPLTVALTARVSGREPGTINYTFWCDREDPGRNIKTVEGGPEIPRWDSTDAITENTLRVERVCTYSEPGTYTPKVIVERGNARPEEARVPIEVTRLELASATPSEFALGVGFSFQDGVTTEDQDYIREGIRIARGYLSANLAVEVPELVTVRVRVSNPGCNAPAQVLGHQIIICTSHPVWTQTESFRRIKIVVHEYFHLLQLEIDWKGPTWLREGSAEFVAFKAIIDNSLISYDQARAFHVLQSTSGHVLPPLQSLESPEGFSSTPGAIYSLGFLAVEFLTSERGVGSLRSYWESTAQGDSWQSAFRAAFGTSTASFYQAFEQLFEELNPIATPVSVDEAIEATTSTPAPIPTFTVVFAERLQPGTIVGPPPDSIPYAFRITAFNLQLLSREQWERLCECPPSSSWGASPEYGFNVYMSPETPPGTYSVILTLPDGRRAETTFGHTISG